MVDNLMTNREERIKEGLIERTYFNSLNVDCESETKRIYKIIKKQCNLSVYLNNIFITRLDSIEGFKIKYKRYFGKLSGNDLSTYYYVWVGLSKGNVVVVGRTSFSKKARSNFGDLFNRYNIFGGVTQEIIMKIIISEKEYLDFKKIEQLNKDLNNFFTHAIIIPVDVGSVDGKDAIKICSDVEKKIGEYLLQNNVKILNKEGHNSFQ